MTLQQVGLFGIAHFPFGGAGDGRADMITWRDTRVYEEMKGHRCYRRLLVTIRKKALPGGMGASQI